MAAALLFAGCVNPIDQMEQSGADGGAAAGKGTALISLASPTTARTVAPDLSNPGYTISYSNGSSSDEVDWDGAGSKNISPPVGIWTITVEGKVDGRTISRGSASNVGITVAHTETQPRAVPITLGRVLGTGRGKLSYSTGTGGISFAGGNLPAGVDTATLTLKPLPVGSGSAVTRNLLPGGSGDIEVDAGDYWLDVTLKRSSDGKQAIKNEVIHIYGGGMVTPLGALAFAENDFAHAKLATFQSVTYDGSTGTGILTLTFDQAITGLAAADINIVAGSTGAVGGRVERQRSSVYPEAHEYNGGRGD